MPRPKIALAVAALLLAACSSDPAPPRDATVATDAVDDRTTPTDLALDVPADVPADLPPAAPGSTEALLREVCAGRPRSGPATAFAYSTAPMGVTGGLQHLSPGDLEAVHLVVERPVRVERLWMMFRGSAGGRVRVRITDDYGRSNPDVRDDAPHDLVDPMEVSFTSTDPVELTLPAPLDLHPARHAWVVVEHVTEPMGLAVAATRGGSYHSYVHSAWQIAQLTAMGGDAATFRWVQVAGMGGTALEYAVEARGQAICERQGAPWFTDVSMASGLRGTTNQYHVVDVDGDGLEDLAGTRTTTTGMTSVDGLQVWRNHGDGTFEEITTRLGLDTAVGRMALWGDFDGDGDADVYAGVYRDGAGPFDPPSQSKVWLQGSDGRFTVVAGDVEPAGPTAAGSVGDCDGDGTLDLFVGQWLRQYPRNAAPDFVFHGLGNGLFANASVASGLPARPDGHPTYGATFVDWDNDGDQDVFVANYGGSPNDAWRNDGHCHLVNVAAQLGSDGDADGTPGTSFGYAFGDYDNDGDLDTYETNIAHPRYDETGVDTDHSRLLRNAGAPGFTFDDVATDSGILFTEGEISSAWGDFDDDGDLDLYVAITYPFEYSRLYRQDDQHHFWDETYLSGTQTESNGRAVWFDVDRDGDLDLLTGPSGNWTVFRNDLHTTNHWIEVRVAQRTGNTAALGARVTVRDGLGVSRIREVEGGTATWGTQSPRTQHVGLGAAGGPATVTVRWPDGTSSDYPGLAVDRIWQLTRGADPRELH